MSKESQSRFSLPETSHSLHERFSSLTDGQQLAVHSSYSTSVFKAFFSRAEVGLPWLRHKDSSMTRDQYVFGMLDAYDVITSQEVLHAAVQADGSTEKLSALRNEMQEKRARLQANRGSLGEYYLTHAQNVLTSLQPEKEALIAKATEWSTAEQNAIIESSRKTLLRLFGKEEKEMLYQRIGLTPESVSSLRSERRKALLKTVGANLVSDGAPFVLGLTAESLLHLGEAVPEQAKLPVQAGILVTEAALLHTLFWENGKENLKSLVETGVSTVALSKLLYTKTKEYTNSEGLQKLGGTLGYAGHHMALESPYVIALITVMAEDLKGGTMLLVSNATSYGINKAKLKASQVHRRFVRGKEKGEGRSSGRVVIDLTAYDDTLEMPLPTVESSERDAPIILFRPQIDGSSALESDY